MTLMKHELRQGGRTLAIWMAAIGLLIAVCVFLFPEMRGEMEAADSLFSSMGSFTAAFGMDRLNFGTLTGFYAVECGNILGLGGSFYAALTAVAALAKEERDGTAEFLLTHPVSRRRVITEKLAAVLAQLVGMNVLISCLAAGSVAAIGEAVPWREMGLLHLAFFLLQVELAGICFGLSAFLRRGSLGLGLGLAAMLYCLNLVANISENAAFLKYITPFGYADGADILASGSLDAARVLLGMIYAFLAVGAGYWKYTRKDIHSV